MAKPPPIRQTYILLAPPARVFAALTDPKVLPKWFVSKATVTPRKGGSFRLSWGKTYTMRGKVLEIQVPRTLRLSWNDRIDGKAFATEARFDLAKHGRGTKLTVTHRGFKSGKKWVALHGGVASGWAYYLQNLRSVLDHGTDLRSPSDAF
jgi:uncharacterized protein YndB with AHSA1/START domain